MEYLVWWLIIGGIAGFIAGQVTKGSGFGVLGNIVVGIVGGIVGGLILNWMGLASYGLVASLVTATLGAILLIAIVNAIAGRRRVA